MDARQCSKRHWLSIHEPLLAIPIEEAELERRAQGQLLTELARRRYPNGVLIEAMDLETAVAATQVAIANGADPIFEAAFAVNGLSACIDVLQRVGRRGRWRVSEVKSSLEVKMDRHLPDLAFQVHVAQLAGLEVTDASILTLNRDYRRDGDVSELFVETPVWKFLRRSLRATPETIEQIKAIVERPEIEVGRHCRSPYDCPFIAHCEAGLPRFHISRIPRLKKQQEAVLQEAGLITFEVLPEAFEATELQLRFVRGELYGERFVAPELKAQLDSIAYPIVFIDFEAVQPMLPVLDRTGPYERIPFQWSAHRLTSLEGAWLHEEFLAEPSGDPRPQFIQTLTTAIEGAATVMYYSPYEPESIAMLARAEILGAAEVGKTLAERGLDLLELVRQNLYLPEFRGRYGIKTVLPALVPGFDYKDLPIQGGDMAQLTFGRMMAGTHPDPESARQALLRYCERDTEAMVRVFIAMHELAAG